MKQFGCNIQHIDIALQAGEVIAAAGSLQIIHVPGHTPGSIALYQPDRRIMFLGDVIRHHPRRGLQVGIPEDYNVDTPQTRRDAQHLVSYPIEQALFSHGTPLLRNAAARLQQAVNDSLCIQTNSFITNRRRKHD
jgi:glyoxylase-like metal-dependent hydrolase (beta-lactamase superfamily II)